VVVEELIPGWMMDIAGIFGTLIIFYIWFKFFELIIEVGGNMGKNFRKLKDDIKWFLKWEISKKPTDIGGGILDIFKAGETYIGLGLLLFLFNENHPLIPFISAFMIIFGLFMADYRRGRWRAWKKEQYIKRGTNVAK